ncbi:hypothetical protein [Pseudozobellia thermophila]|uniref:Lipoprotein n=1 Tax=Pseudozobellia thermophila TaxID=192903 RepID=A0A1M6C277_9FLAO|nr:hypothetical protein [Pseudozobellia thermophila]SHI55127.1 hypothetical protein SAMN04488513_101615 [Pseudozobellia thermophila]
MRTSRKTPILSLACVVATAVLMLACNKGDDGNPLGSEGACYGDNWAEFYMDELQAFSDATVAYSADPTAENCSRYTAAGNDYLDALETVYQCVPTASRAQIEQAIKEAKEGLEETCQ